MSHINSTKIFLLLALVAVLIENALTSRIVKSKAFEARGLQSTNDGSTSSDPDADETLPIYIPAETCPRGYNKRNSGCILKGAKFSIESANGLINLDLPNDEQVPAHHVVFTVYGFAPGSEEKVVVAGMPVEIVPVEAKQNVYALDGAQVKRTKVKAYDRFRVATNAMGRAAFSFPIVKDEDLRLQKMLARADYMDVNGWFAFHADTAAITALSKINAQHLRAADANLSPEEAESNAQEIRTLFGVTAENDNRVYLNEADQTILLAPNSESKKESRKLLTKRGDVKDLEKDLEQIKVEAVKTGTIVKQGGRRVIKALIKGSKKLIEVIITTIATAVRVFLQILKVLGLTAKVLLNLFTTHVTWKDVKATHVKFMHDIYAVRRGVNKGSIYVMDGIVKSVWRSKDNLDRVMETILQHLRALESASATGLVGVNQYTYMTDIIISIGDQVKFKNVDPVALENLINLLQNIKQQVIDSDPNMIQHPLIVKSYAKVERSLQAAKNRGFTVKIVNALFQFIKLILNVISGTATVVTVTAALAWGFVVEMFWGFLEIGIEVPQLPHMERPPFEGPNGERYLTLLSLFVLPASYLYTYGYMLTHNGKAPFPKTLDVTLPSNSQQTNAISPPALPPHGSDANPAAPQPKDTVSEPPAPALKISEEPTSPPALKKLSEPTSSSKESKDDANSATAAKLEDVLEPITPSAHSDNLIDLEPDTPSAGGPGSNAQGLSHLLDRRSELVRRASFVSSETMKALVEVSNSFGGMASATGNIFAGIGILQVVAAMGSIVSQTEELIEA
ncbi:hypothetical protein HK102_012402 [Quaeritorhiza haematococci]|nr:hypothetical protein HK102_012402 [Quaeritorhiza haematococci]